MSATLLPGISVSNPGYSGLSLEVYTQISVSDKVYEDRPVTLYPDVSVSNLGYTLGVYRSTGLLVSDTTTRKEANSCSNKIYYFNVEDSFIHF